MASASAQVPADANANNPPNLDLMSFKERQKFFEKQIKEQENQPAKAPAKQFSYLADHEIAKMRQEEAKKTANMSQEQLRSYVTSTVADMAPDQDLDHVLLSLDTRRMKSLEADAVRAQAVIAKAQELSRDPATRPSQPGGPPLAAVDIAFADDDDSHQNHNGNSQRGIPNSDTGSKTRPTIVIHRGPGTTLATENVKVLDECVRSETQEVFNEKTGKTEFKTVQIVETVLEREIEVTTQRLLTVNLRGSDGSKFDSEAHG